LLRPKPSSSTATIANNNNSNGVSLINDSINNKRAKLIEIISSETREETVTSAKRKRALRTINSSYESRDTIDYDDSTSNAEKGGNK
jgi:hypothetical protein